MTDYRRQLRDAVRHFWVIRDAQGERQGASSGRRDYGNRGSVTGGAQLDGFVSLFARILTEYGLPQHAIHVKQTTLPGYFRPTKEWDIVVVADGQLVATIELKSHIGPSFGNNFNNRVEEALGSATDILTAYREGAFKPSERPWLGYFMLLEKHHTSTRPVRAGEPHFSVFPEFVGASYQERYERFCERLMQERLYDAACFIISSRDQGQDGAYEEPNPELSFSNFAASLIGKAVATAQKLARTE